MESHLKIIKFLLSQIIFKIQNESLSVELSKIFRSEIGSRKTVNEMLKETQTCWLKS